MSNNSDKEKWLFSFVCLTEEQYIQGNMCQENQLFWNHLVHLNLWKAMYKPYMISPWSTYLTKHKLLQRGPVTKEINISKACHLLHRQSQRKKCRVCTRRDPKTSVGVGFMPLRISSASYTYSDQWFECLLFSTIAVIQKSTSVRDDNNEYIYNFICIMRPIIYKIWIHYKSKKGPSFKW